MGKIRAAANAVITPYNQSAAKAITIIEHLASCDNEPQRLQDIASSLSMNTSTVFRYLQSLIETDYVWQNPGNARYALTTRICSIAYRVSSNIRLYDQALPIMNNLAAAFEESVCLAIEQDRTVVYIGVVQGPNQMLRTTQYIGNRAPMHCTGVGKLLLLNYSNGELDALINEKGLPRFTKNTLSTREDLMAEIAVTRRRDYAVDDEECEMGARCIAVPIRDYTSRIVAAISVTGPTFRMDSKLQENKLSTLMEAGALLSRRLGYNAFAGDSATVI